MNNLAILLLAAGASSRMRGADKLLEKVDGKPLLSKLAKMAVDTGCPVFVTLPALNSQRLHQIANLPLVQVEVEDASDGMSASLRAGINILPAGIDGVMVLLADMPEITSDDLAVMMAAFAANPDKVIRATDADDQDGHPVIFPRRLLSALRGLEGDKGARQVLQDETLIKVELPDRHATTDLDTPEQWLAWRKANPFRN